jgi:hypothetical protein
MLPRRVVLLAGRWIEAQDIFCHENLWSKVLILSDMEAQLIEERNDGWRILESVQTQLRYKCWITDFLEVRG